MAEMGWLHATAWWHLTWLLPGLLGIAAWAAWRRNRHLAILLGTAEASAIATRTTLSPPRRRLRFLLLLAAVILLVVALARPYWGLRLLPFSGRGRDVMIVLDVSRSMLADDLKPSRLAHAKWLLRELIKATPGDRYGIVAFAGGAFLQCPLTSDQHSLFMYLDELTPASIPVGGTCLERALQRALAAFAAAGGRHRAVLLVSDGDDLVGDSRATVAEFAARNLPLLVVGLGDPAGSGLIPLPSEDGKSQTLLRDRQGQLVVSRLNETTLRALATGTPGGLYLHSTVTDPGLELLKKQIAALMPEEYATGQRQRPVERFPLPLAAAVALLLLRLVIGERRPTAAIGIAALILVGQIQLAAQATPPPAEPPPQAAAPQPNPTATTPPTAIAAAPPLPPWQEYNQARKWQEDDQLEDARRGYERAINQSADRPEIRARAYHNLGVAAHRAARQIMPQDPEAALRELVAAEDFYRESLRLNVNPAEVARNQQLLLADRRQAEEVLKKIQQMREKQQQASKQTRDAHDAQQQANERPKDQPQDQPQPDQPQANAKTEQAQQATEQFRQAAEQAGQPQPQQSAEQAAKAIEQARDAQRQGDGKTAAEKLAQAMQALGNQQDGDPPPPPPPGEAGAGQGQNQPPPSGQPIPPQNAGSAQPNPGDPAGEPPPEPSGEIDPQQATALLDLMAQEEKDLRDELRERMRRDAQIKPVDQDW